MRAVLPICRTVWAIACSLFPVVAFPVIATAASPVDFNRDIRPILSQNCFACHGPDAEHREAGLRLDQRDAALKPADSGAAAIVPGHADASELLRRVASNDRDARMPPADSAAALQPRQISLLKQWIAEGANYAQHWSLEKPHTISRPDVKNRVWPKNPIDEFILARLERERLEPSPEADRYALIRRLSFDLRGLPPTPGETERFIADKSSDAYERLVDRLLADKAYGERWARVWLDLARYADSKGYGSDPLRVIWRYRDWVIDAFNNNLPFDQFTIQQIAGDLLPKPTPDQLMATAFHRNTMTNTEGGTDDEEFRVAAVKDRVDTTMQVWMGLTLGCAKCHNHKYDPFSQREYYQLYDIFNQSADTDRGDEEPTMPAPTAEIQEAIKHHEAQLAALKKQLDTSTPELAASQTAWEKQLTAEPPWSVLAPVATTSTAGSTFEKLPDGSLLVKDSQATKDKSANDNYTITAETDLSGITGFRLEALPQASLPGGGSGRGADGSFVLSRFTVSAAALPTTSSRTGRFVRVELAGKDRILALAEVQAFVGSENVARGGQARQSSLYSNAKPERAIDGNTDGDYAKQSTSHTATEANPWWEVDLKKDQPLERIAVWNRTDGGTASRSAGMRVSLLDAKRNVVWQAWLASANAPQPSREFVLGVAQELPAARAMAAYSRSGHSIDNLLKLTASDAGWSVEPRQKERHAAVFALPRALVHSPRTRLTFRIEHSSKAPADTLGCFRISATTSRRVLDRVALPADVLAIVDTPTADRRAEAQAKLAGYYRSIAPELNPVRKQIAELDKSRPKIPTLPIMSELPANKRRVTRVLVKGNFLVPGETVEAGTPAALHPLAKDAPRNRLGLARWLVDPENPLTARVMVNRFWAQLFGTGLVETEEDFGTQGVAPSHPELLDWLAGEFVREHWDIKRLLRLMVTSAAYRQSSAVSSQLVNIDPDNRLLARGPRFRLEAEMVRDQALALSGLLSPKMHGASVFPLQPDGLWQAAFNGERTWATSSGEDRYRRALYTFWRRTIPYPSMATFDAPSREICAIRRIRTNTPLQAFVTLNDPVYVEAAQALARRMVRDGGSNPEDRVRFALRLCMVRPPQPGEVARLVALYQSEFEHYRKDPAAAEQLATKPLGPLPAGMDARELAAWTVVANVLLNLDAVLMKG
jgi:mono/diheme cytochrome c family protein